jgi:hypothetical protein
MKLRLLLLGLALSLTTPAWSQEKISSGDTRAAHPRMVKTWVAPYAIPDSLARLKERYGGVKAGPRNALTHLGLQFWVPTQGGGVTRATRYGAISDATIAEFRTWGRRNGVKILLTVYNGENGWDWALAKQAFGDNKSTFIDALIPEMEQHGLDGVDVDLEGPGMDATEDDKTKYVAFIKGLSGKLRNRDKHLVLDSFSYVWNAPNTTWWPDLFRYVDGIVSMGYESIGLAQPSAGEGIWQSYEWQRTTAGKQAHKLLLGMPSHLDSWRGNTAVEQIAWAKPKRQKVGVAIWDAQNAAALWRTPEVWRQLRAIREQ